MAKGKPISVAPAPVVTHTEARTDSTWWSYTTTSVGGNTTTNRVLPASYGNFT
jgi:hypothetical protein